MIVLHYSCVHGVQYWIRTALLTFTVFIKVHAIAKSFFICFIHATANTLLRASVTYQTYVKHTTIKHDKLKPDFIEGILGCMSPLCDCFKL